VLWDPHALQKEEAILKPGQYQPESTDASSGAEEGHQAKKNRQDEVTGEADTARAAALLQPDTESTRQGVSFCLLISPVG